MENFILENVDRVKIIEMLKEEEKVRHSKQIQDIYVMQYEYALKNPNYQNVNIEKEIQKRILTYYGYNDSDDSLNEYWKIPSKYWNDEEVKISIYNIKINILLYPKVENEKV